nr:EOG090X0DYO [Ilyocryptus agilis]
MVKRCKLATQEVYQASTSTRTGPGGVREVHRSVSDSRSGVRKMAIGRHLGERGHVREKEQNYYTGEQEEREDFINIEEGYSKLLNLQAAINCSIPRRHFKPKWVAPTLRDFKNRKDIENDQNGGEKIFHRSTFLEWNYDAELYAFTNRIGEKIDDSLLRCALTHRSYIEKETKRLLDLGLDSQLQLVDNEQLAEKGNSMITKFVRGYLRAVFSRVPEELISSLHDYLVSTSVLSDVAKHIGLGDIMLCADFPCEPETFAKSLKALVAALEQTSGEEKARIFVQDLIVTQLYGRDVNELWNPRDPVGILATILKREGRGEPEFRLIRKAGANTILAVYHVGIYSDKIFIAEGAGESLEIAQEIAARDALKRLFHTEDSMKALPFGRQLKAFKSKIEQLENHPNVSLNEWTSTKFSSVAH